MNTQNLIEEKMHRDLLAKQAERRGLSFNQIKLALLSIGAVALFVMAVFGY